MLRGVYIHTPVYLPYERKKSFGWLCVARYCTSYNLTWVTSHHITPHRHATQGTGEEEGRARAVWICIPSPGGEREKERERENARESVREREREREREKAREIKQSRQSATSTTKTTHARTHALGLRRLQNTPVLPYVLPRPTSPDIHETPNDRPRSLAPRTRGNPCGSHLVRDPRVRRRERAPFPVPPHHAAARGYHQLKPALGHLIF